MTIDILMPFYGDPGQFRAAVGSVLAQSDGRWRLTIVDDAYPDPAPGSWAATIEDERVGFLRNPVNLGINGAFNRCVTLVEHDHFVIMGCDDLLTADYVRQMHQAIHDHPRASYLQPAVSIIGDDGERLLPLADRVKDWSRPHPKVSVELGGEKLTASLLRGNWTYFPSICWRTADVQPRGFDPKYSIVLDLALQLELLMSGATMALLPGETFRYRRHESSVSEEAAKYGSRFAEERELFLEVAPRLHDMGWTKAAKAAEFHVTSRLNALTKLPASLLHDYRPGTNELVRHVFTNRPAR
ncbi:glycosyltransferase [Leifsonia shinshuensis]|uniref:Glycosyltransferase n=2 Tax=Leifsonia shinshuensis TaxID=150026 RepID=A0A7G6YGJ1_9MICO|nr:glycosyltransferase [Leifsonia shinshuensis]